MARFTRAGDLRFSRSAGPIRARQGECPPERRSSPQGEGSKPASSSTTVGPYGTVDLRTNLKHLPGRYESSLNLALENGIRTIASLPPAPVRTASP